MPAKLYRVNLTQDEREHLLGVTRRGKSSGRKPQSTEKMSVAAC